MGAAGKPAGSGGPETDRLRAINPCRGIPTGWQPATVGGAPLARSTQRPVGQGGVGHSVLTRTIPLFPELAAELVSLLLQASLGAAGLPELPPGGKASTHAGQQHVQPEHGDRADGGAVEEQPAAG